MTPLRSRALFIALAFAAGLAIPLLLGAGGQVTSPTGTAPDRYVYYPGTEALGKDEIRIIACGTGMPAARRGQAASCFLVELGNGDKFLFDLGTGSMANLASLMIPMNMLTKVLVSHLHTDHIGDLAGLWAGGWTAGRTRPLEVWGPSGSRADMGTAHFVKHFLEAYNWDYMTRAAVINPTPGSITAHEFDHKGENEVIYDENGVVIRAWPAIHAGDGPVSYALYWKDFKIVYSGDAIPSKWFNEYAQDSDVIIHETFLTPDQLVALYNQPPQRALMMNRVVHTSAQAFGKLMSMMKPRHAIAFHFFYEPATRYGIYDGVRETYAGPVSMATDMMVWNVTKDAVVERMAVSTDEAWDVPGEEKGLLPDPSRKSELSPEMMAGIYDVTDVDKGWMQEFSKKHGIKPPPMPGGTGQVEPAEGR